jgi:hypothetical protein
VVKEAIQKINKGQLVANPNIPCLSNLTYIAPVATLKTDSPLFNKCATDLCGPVENNQSVWITDTNFSTNISPQILKKIDALNPTFEEIFKLSQKNNLKELAAVKKFLASKKYGIDQLDSIFKEQLNDSIFAPYLEKTINLKAPLDQRVEVKVKIPAGANQGFILALKNYATNLSKSITSNIYSISFQNIYKDEEIIPLAKLNLQKIKERFLANKNTIEANTKQDIENEILSIEKSLKDNQTSFNASVAISNLVAIDKKIAKDSQSEIFKDPGCDIASCAEVYSHYLNDQVLQKKIASYEEMLNSPTTMKNAINRCKSTVIAGEMESSNLKKSQAIFEEAKKTIIKNVLPRFSEHSRGILLNYLSQKLTSTNKNSQMLLFTTMTAEAFTQSAKDFIQDQTSGGFGPDFSPQSLWEKVTVIDKSFDEIDPLDGVSPCGTNLPSNAWDAFIPVKATLKRIPDNNLKNKLAPLGEKDNIFISDFSCEHAANGVHNTEHEIGHAISYIFATTKLSGESLAIYNKLRKCASDNYPTAPHDTTYTARPTDKVFTEEDTADLFAFIASNSTQDQDKNKTKKIYSCELLRPSNSNNSYADLSFYEDNNNHSTPFTRVLIEAVNKDITLPDSCKKLVEEEKPSVRFNKCI